MLCMYRMQRAKEIRVWYACGVEKDIPCRMDARACADKCIWQCMHVHVRMYVFIHHGRKQARHLHGIRENARHRCGDSSSPYVWYERRLPVCKRDNSCVSSAKKKREIACVCDCHCVERTYPGLFYAWFRWDLLSKTWPLCPSICYPTNVCFLYDFRVSVMLRSSQKNACTRKKSIREKNTMTCKHHKCTW